ncbi:MAG TPA: hypothetical protein VM143_14385 [Acidimicrobiales bacterium]|nr:hypothetical protein [Acidimicrobiales bacterium]
MSDDTTIACASYTHARRHPMVLGHIAGWTPPFQLTITQVLVALTTFMLLTWSWQVWAPLLPSTLSLIAAVGLPCTAAWVVRHLRVEGRSLARTALGYVALLSAPTGGQAGGRPVRPARAARTNAAVWFGEESRG